VPSNSRLIGYKIMKFTLFILTLLPLSLSAEELVENGNFASAKARWTGDGKVVYLDSAGKEAGSSSSSTETLCRLTLNPSQWQSIEQKIRVPKGVKSLNLSVEVRASSDFERSDKERLYSKEDFKEGGHYTYSSKVLPRVDFMIMLSNKGGWLYRPFSLKSAGSWKSLSSTIDSIVDSEMKSFTILVPPGTGSVDIRKVSLSN
jgi:hypothetical protein